MEDDLAVGDKLVIDGIEYEVLWSGGEGLTSVKETKVGDDWVAPPRLYNKTGKYSKKKPEEQVVTLINPLTED